jgi:branched-chain amino acid transport system ATP-binding protein
VSLIRVADLHVYLGESHVLQGVSFEVEEGGVTALLGRNGVGKTTTMRAIMGLTPPTGGAVLWQGREVTGWAPNRAARSGVGFVPEDRRIFADLTVWENLEVAQRAASRPGRWHFESVCELFPKLRELADRRGGNLSGGEQQMLTIARTLMGNPELLLLDEPSEGLAPLVVEHLLEQVRLLRDEGLTILLAEQGVDFSLALADRVYVLEKGSVRHSGAAEELRRDEALRNSLMTL